MGFSLLRVLNGMSVKAVGYAEDIAFLAEGAYEEVLRNLVQVALKVKEAWCRDNSLRIQDDNMVALIFTRRYSMKAFERVVIGNRAISYEKCTNYLGRVLDRKLLWRKHLGKKCEVAIFTFWQCRGALGVRSGLSPRQVHWIYSTIIVTRLAFA